MQPDDDVVTEAELAPAGAQVGRPELSPAAQNQHQNQHQEPGAQRTDDEIVGEDLGVEPLDPAAPVSNVEAVGDVEAGSDLGALEVQPQRRGEGMGAQDVPGGRAVEDVPATPLPDEGTADDPVAQAAALLETVPTRALDEHVEVFGQIHSRLQQALAEIDNA